MINHKERLAIVLLNLGGPDSLQSVRPFLKNLFSDPAIIALPCPIRQLLAEIISRARTSKAQKIYNQIGGRSPLLTNTQAQSRGLAYKIKNLVPDSITEIFIAMRYWHPFTVEAVDQVVKFQPSKVILLPLYPQFSSTTTGSSFSEWYKQTKKKGLKAPTFEIVSYPQHPNFIKAHIDLLKPWIKKASQYGTPRILFSAHGLPQKVIKAGDPYEIQVHETVTAIMGQLSSNVEGVVCYQSKVGPLKWLGPSTEEEIKRAGAHKAPVIIVPVTFVSEHVETLVELDQDYYNLATSFGVPFYGRVPALGDHPTYMQALAELVKASIK